MAESGKQPSSSDPGTNAAASAAAFLDEARAKTKANDNQGALICLRAVAGLAGCPPDMRMEAAKMLAQAGDAETAIGAYIEAGNTYLTSSKEYQKARQAFQAGHALDVHNLDVIYMLGQADVEDGRLQDGLAKFIDVLRKSNLKHVPALFAAGCIYQTNGQFDQAMLAFKKVLDRDKNHVMATVRIGQLYQSKEQMADAIAYYVQAAQLARESQSWGSARQIASMVAAIDPQNQRARIILDELEEQGHTAEALADEQPLQTSGPARIGSGQRPLQMGGAKPIPSKQAAGTSPAAATDGAKTPAVAAAAHSSAKAQTPAVTQPASSAATRPSAGNSEQTAPLKPATPPLVAQVAARQSPPRPEEAPKPAVEAKPSAQHVAPVAAAPDDSRLERAGQMLAAIEAQREAAQQDLQLLLQTRNDLQKALAEQRTLLETAAMRKKDLDVQLSEAQSKLDAAKNAGAEAVAQTGDDKAELASLAAERVALESALQALRGETETLSARKAADENGIRELQALRDETMGEVSALTAKMQDAKKLTDELEAMQAAASDAQAQASKASAASAELIALDTQRSALMQEIEEAKGRLSSLQAEIAQATEAAERSVRERDEAKAEIAALNARLQELKAASVELEQKKSAHSTNDPPPEPPAASPANGGPQGGHAGAAAFLAAGDFGHAIDAYKAAFESNPQDAAAAYQAGALLAEHSDDLEAAERLLNQAAELRGDHAATRYQLALVKARRGNVVEGTEMLTALARADANNSEFVDQFAEHLEKDAASGDLNAKFRLGIAYRELGRIEEALVTLQAIQHEQGMVVPCLIAIGSCLRRQGLDGAAAKRFAKAIETPGYPDPMYLEALYNLGELYEAKGTQESLALALQSFEELYARDLTYRDIGERVRVVKTNISSAERQKVKRLPTRIADSQGNQ